MGKKKKNLKYRIPLANQEAIKNSNADAIIAMQNGTYTPPATWNSFYQLYPQFHPSNIPTNGYGKFDSTFDTYRPKNNDYSLYLADTASPIDKRQFGRLTLSNGGLFSTLDSYNKIVSAPLKTDIGTVLQNFPEAKYWSDETLQAFADNYRLGMASLYDPNRIIESGLKSGKTWKPIVDSPGEIQYRFQGHKYNAITDPKQIKFDPVYGLVIDKQYKTAAKGHSTGLIGRFVDRLSSSPLPTLGLLASAYFGLPATGLGETAGTAAGAAAAPTGLASLPTAGTWAHTATPALGAGAGSWTLPSALTGVSGATTAAGGLTLADAIAAAPGSGTTTAGAVGTGGATSSGLPNFDLPFQNPSSISPIGETPAVSGNGLGTVGSTPPDLGTGMITSPEGLSGLVNSQPIGTTLGAATPGTTGGYLVPSLGGEALATTAAAGGLASSASSVTDWLGKVFNQGVDKFMSDPLKNTLNLVSGISSYLGNNAQAKALEDYLKQGLSQSDPFGSQRAYYMDRLKNTYTNPEGYLKSPEYSAISKRRLEALERADAAQGRRSQYGARAEKMHEFDLENLMKERTMLAQLAGSGISPSQVSSLMNGVGVGSAQAQVNAPGNLLFMLNEIFGGKK